METQNQKWVNVSFLGVAVLLSYILFSVLLKASGVFDLETKIKNFELVVRLGSIAFGAAVFVGLYKWHTANQFLNEVVEELTQVTWPSQKETISSTWIVLIFVLVASGLIAIIDWVWTSFIQWILK